MLGEFINSILVTVLGFAYPAFECFKTLERNRVDMDDLRFWCQYWIIIAILSVIERFGDIFISWVPMYAELKLGFIIYLWYPKTKGTNYIYDSLLRPFVARHETDIDQHLQELRLRVWDLAIYYWQNCTDLGQGAFFQVIDFLANRSSRIKGGDRSKKNNTSNKRDHLQSKGGGGGGGPSPPVPPPPALPRDFIPQGQDPLRRLIPDNYAATSAARHRGDRTTWSPPQPSAPPMAGLSPSPSPYYRSVAQATKSKVVQLEPDEAHTEYVHVEEDEIQGMDSLSPKQKVHFGLLRLGRSKQQ